MTTTDTDGLVERIVAGTAHSWTIPSPHKAGEVVYFTARHGDRVRVSAAEAERGEAMGTLVDEEVARRNQQTRDELLAEIGRLQNELEATRASQPPAVLAPPPAPEASTTLTPSMTGIPMVAELPDSVGPIGPTNADAVAAAMAATKGAPVVEVTPVGTPLTHTGVVPVTGPGSSAPGAELPGGIWDDDRLNAANAGEVVAYLGQHSDNLDEVDRVDGLEANRSRGPRKTVTDAIEAIRAEAAEREE
jgi:hypothetical protein